MGQFHASQRSLSTGDVNSHVTVVQVKDILQMGSVLVGYILCFRSRFQICASELYRSEAVEQS